MPKKNGIFFTDIGSGTPLILIHGFCETHEVWSELVLELSSHCRVISIDLPGFGGSDLPQIPFSISTIGKKINQLLVDLSILNPIVIGHSLGGYVTLAMVENNYSLFEGFGLFHSTAYPDFEEKKVSRNKVIEFVEDHGVAPFIQSFVPPLFFNPDHPQIKFAIELGLKTKLETLTSYTAAMRDRPDQTGILKEFKKPIFFLAGEEDKVVNVEVLNAQAKMASLPFLTVLKSVAHMGMFEDKTASLRSIKAFLGFIKANQPAS